MALTQHPYDSFKTAQMVYQHIPFVFDEFHFKIIDFKEYVEHFGNWRMTLVFATCGLQIREDRGCIDADFAFMRNSQIRDHAISIETLAQWFGAKNNLVGQEECNRKRRLQIIASFLQEFLPQIVKLFSEEMYPSVRLQLITGEADHFNSAFGKFGMTYEEDVGPIEDKMI